ncbi:MAG TPA: adenylate cyclase regulatory domain-containing protein, partial [Acidimicrobiales bacterium]|nr:adenylate cyclase regulatory domain-containing protein [Acidimicrobiales bacterium]
MSDSPIERRLLALGATPREIAFARERRVLGLLAAVHEVLPAEAKYSSRELAGVVGVDEDVARRLWRAMGFADPAEGERPFTDADAEVLAIAAGFLASGTTTIEESVQMTRVIASSMARIAEAMVPSPPPGGRATSAEADELFAQVARPTFDTYSKLLDYVWRRHLQAVLRRRLLNELEPDPHGGVHAIGFADLVGFTALSQQLEPSELAEV